MNDERLFDAHARIEAVPEADLETLAFFGTAALVTCAHDGYPGVRAEDLDAHLASLVDEVPARVRRAGITPYVAVGVHPGKIPWLGLEAVLSRMPERLDRPEVVAVGEVGLSEGGEREETVFRRQIELALELRLPLLVYLPEKGRDRLLRRTLAILREAEFPPERAMLVRVGARGLGTVRGLGFRAALGGMSAAEAAAAVARHGPEGLLLSSNMGDGLSDPLLPSRTVAEMEAAGLSRAVIRRVVRENAEAFFDVRPT